MLTLEDFINNKVFDPDSKIAVEIIKNTDELFETQVYLNPYDIPENFYNLFVIDIKGSGRNELVIRLESED